MPPSGPTDGVHLCNPGSSRTGTLAPLLRRALGCLKMRDRSHFSGGSGIAVNHDNAKGAFP